MLQEPKYIVSLSPSGDGVDAKGLETFFLEIGLEDGVSPAFILTKPSLLFKYLRTIIASCI